MSTNVLRTADGWWVVRDSRAVRIDTKVRHHPPPNCWPTATPYERPPRAARREYPGRRPRGPLSPVTTPCRVVAQMVNYRSHARDSGFSGDIPATFFRKASGSSLRPRRRRRPSLPRELPRLRGRTRPRHAGSRCPWAPWWRSGTRRRTSRGSSSPTTSARGTYS
ncbi:hypothetical protein ACRAWF_38610 [Streptomyces sp. L7]